MDSSLINSITPHNLGAGDRGYCPYPRLCRLRCPPQELSKDFLTLTGMWRFGVESGQRLFTTRLNMAPLHGPPSGICHTLDLQPLICSFMDEGVRDALRLAREHDDGAGAYI